MKYRTEIDGLRFVAVVPVVFFHAGVPGFEGGYLGVDVFFVISGYLITTLVANELREGRFSIVRFYERRARRLMPALFVMLAGTTLAALWISPPQLLIQLGESLVAVPLYISNLLFWRRLDYFATASDLNPLLHTWSLAVEEQFYLVFPTLLGLLLRFDPRRTRWWILALAGVSIGVMQVGSDPFFLAPPRAWELLAGAALALFPEVGLQLRDRPRLEGALASLGLALVLGSLAVFDQTFQSPSLYTLLPVLGTVLTLLAANPGNRTGRLLSWAPLVHVGLISYSLYLWHQPLLALTIQHATFLPSTATVALMVLLSFVFGDLSWRYIEAPFRSSSGTTRRQILGGTLAASIASILVGLNLIGSRGLPQRFDESVLSAFAASKRGERDCLQIAGEPEAPCPLGAPGTPTVLLLGDSHADAMQEAFSDLLLARGQSGAQLSRIACAPVAGSMPEDRGSRHQCAAFNAYALERASDPSIQTIVVHARWARVFQGPVRDGRCHEDVNFEVRDLPEPEQIEALRLGLARLAATGKDVLIIESMPEFGCSVPWTLAKLRMRDGGSFELPRAQHEARTAASRVAFDRLNHENVRRFDPAEVLCDATSCTSERDGQILYWDDDHVSEAGATLLLERIVEKGLL